MSVNEDTTFNEYEQLPIPIICFNSDIKVHYLNNEAKDVLKKINTLEPQYQNHESKSHIPIWFNPIIKQFAKSDYVKQKYINKTESKGEFCVVQLICKKIFDEDNNFNEIKVIINDITEHLELREEMQNKLQEVRTSLEEQLVKMQKINSLSILAAGIAHDFNNILTLILGNIFIIRTYLNISTNKTSNDIYKKFSQIEKLTLQAKDLNEQLMNFSKDGIPIKKNIYIRNLVKSTANMVLSGSNNLCKISISQDLWPVEVDEGQIRQVINNLLINAEQAMPDGGIIEVSANNEYVEENNKKGIKQGKYIMLKIRDRGKGISKENINKIFEPYFTTKDNGTGLGLAASHSIITKHNGYIFVESKELLGASFFVYLRASESEVIVDRIKQEKAIQGTGRVLVMDDDKNIREINRLMLMELGYEVEIAKNGEDVIKAYKDSMTHHNFFNAVILDLTIRGGMGGKETIENLLEIDKKVNAIVVSGYSSDCVMQDCRAYGFKECIKKPYTLEKLATVLYKVIDKSKTLK